MNKEHQTIGTPSSNIEVKSIAPISVVGKHCIGTQDLSATFNAILEWAAPKGLLIPSDFKMATLYYDSFKTTTKDKVRMFACLLVDKAQQSEGHITATQISGGNYITAHYEIGIYEFERVWTNLFQWMNDKGYQLRKEPPFEIYHNDFNQHPKKKCVVDLYIPVE